MADEGSLEERFLEELYGLAKAQATRVVSGEELARRMGMEVRIVQNGLLKAQDHPIDYSWRGHTQFKIRG
jgi:hypothetical protein